MYQEEGVGSTLRVTDMSVDDKPREKALKNGIQSLSKAELMAIILGSGIVGKSVIALSQEMLRDHGGNLSLMLSGGADQLCSKYKGIGPAKAISLMAAFELGSRCVEDASNLPVQICGGDSVYKLMRQKLQTIPHEEFWVLHLSRANRLIASECISRGGTAATVVDVKLIMKSALNKLSSALILVHNHPSGNLYPSTQDDDITRRIAQAAKLLEIRMLDHVIISPTGYYSYNDQGKI